MSTNRRHDADASFLTGRAAESRAIEKLLELGMTIVTRNYRVRGGEVDIIALEGDEWVLIEVKHREYQEEGFGALDPEQLARIWKTGQHYLAEHEIEAKSLRLDAIVLTNSQVMYERSVFEPS